MKTIARWTVGAVMGSALMLTAGLTAQASELVVIETTGSAGVAAGDIIASGSSMTVPAGATVTLIGEDGTPVTLTGPFTGVPQTSGGTGGNADMSVLAGLLSSDSKSTASLGVIRNVGTKATADVPDPYLVNVDVSGDRCLGADGSVVLYRGDGSAAQPLVLGEMVGGKVVRSTKPVTWPAGAEQLRLPAQMSKMFRAGSTWQVKVGGNSADLTFHAMPASLGNATQKAVWMAKQNCKPQAVALINSLR